MKILTICSLILKCLIITLIIYLSIRTYIPLGVIYLPVDSYEIHYNDDFYYFSICKHGSSFCVDINSGDKVGYNDSYIFGKRSRFSWPTDAGEDEYFTIDLKDNKTYIGGSIEQLCEQCGIESELFDSTYPVSFYYHYARFIGGIFK